MDQATARAFDRGIQGQSVTKTVTDKKDRRDNPIYASRELDEYGLTPNELRVYFRIARRAGEEGKLFGSITSQDIAEALNRQGYSLDRRRIELDHPIRTVGEHVVAIRLHPEVHAELRVSIIAE